MSAAHPAVDHHAEGHNAGHDASHGSLQGYLTGFVLSAILTAIPFWLAMGHVLPAPLYTALAIMILAAAQILVHMVFFLHMNTKSEGGWIMLALIFTLVFVSVTLIGSMWVMYHLNVNMMPMTAQDMRNAP
jgi:cytochrome o ubiquinol oxidase operon protein cyoD